MQTAPQPSDRSAHDQEGAIAESRAPCCGAWGAAGDGWHSCQQLSLSLILRKCQTHPQQGQSHSRWPVLCVHLASTVVMEDETKEKGPWDTVTSGAFLFQKRGYGEFAGFPEV